MQQRFYNEFKRDVYMEIILTIIPKNLVKNSLLSLFYPFIETKIRIKCSDSWCLGNEKQFCFLVITRPALLQRYEFIVVPWCQIKHQMCLRQLAGFRYEKKRHFVKIVTSLVTVLFKMTLYLFIYFAFIKKPLF